MAQPDARRMILRARHGRRHRGADQLPMLRATGIAAFLANGGALEHAQEIAVHEGRRATKLYNRTNERLTQD